MTLLTLPHPLIPWLLDGNVAIQYQVHRDLLGQERPDLRARIAAEGSGKQFLADDWPAAGVGGSYQPVDVDALHATGFAPSVHRA